MIIKRYKPYRAISVISLIFLALCMSVQAQESSPNILEEDDVILKEPDYGDFSIALERETQRYSSKDSLDEIPPHSLYHTIFVIILSNEEYYISNFPVNDWKLIQELPSHYSRRLFEPVISSIKSTCYALNQNKALELSFDQSLTLYGETARNSDEILDRHYTKQYEALSDTGKKVIDSIKNEFNGTNNLVYSTTDFAAAAKDFPEIATAHMEARCEEINQIKINLIPETRTLKEDLESRQWNRF